jgi:hypothetical protein
MRDSEAPAQQQHQAERSMSGEYEQVGTQTDFRNITVILFSFKRGSQ